MDITNFVNGFSDVEISKPNCKLCNSKLRKEAEGMVECGASVLSIHRFIERGGEQISYNAVANHVHYHFKAKQSETDLIEYASELEKWSKMSMADAVIIDKYVKMLDREITLIGAKNAHVDLQELRKNQEIMLKMQAQVMSLKESGKKLNAEQQPIEILFTSLNRIIEAKLTSGITPDAKKALQDVIDQLRKEVGEVPIEGKKLEN